MNGAVLANVQNDLERVVCYASQSLNNLVKYIRHFKHCFLGRRFKIIPDHRALKWLHNCKDLDALTARWLGKLAAFDYEIEQRSGKSIGHANCMSRLPATTAALNMTTTMNFDASIVWQSHPSSQKLLSSNSQTPSAQQLRSITIQRDTIKNNQIDDEQSEVRYGNEAGKTKAIRLMMSSPKWETATQPEKAKAIKLIMSSLKSNTGTNPVQTNQYHNSWWLNSKLICWIFYIQ